MAAVVAAGIAAATAAEVEAVEVETDWCNNPRCLSPTLFVWSEEDAVDRMGNAVTEKEREEDTKTAEYVKPRKGLVVILMEVRSMVGECGATCAGPLRLVRSKGDDVSQNGTALPQKSKLQFR